jgi:hypothetical protein
MNEGNAPQNDLQRTFECTKCGKEFETKRAREVHQRKEHQKKSICRGPNGSLQLVFFELVSTTKVKNL